MSEEQAQSSSAAAVVVAPAPAASKKEELPVPEFVPHRIRLFEECKLRREVELGDKKGQPIKVTLPDGAVKEGQAYITTPFDIASAISVGLANAAIVAKVNDELWDLGRPLEGDCSLALLKWDEEEAKKVFWHSSSHVLGQAMERLYNCNLCTGPALKDGGFFYEAFTGNSIISQHDYPTIEKLVDTIVKQKQPFERILVTKDEAKELFKDNRFKLEIITNKVPEGSMCSVYRCGDLVDPCRGPHVHNTGRVKAFMVTKNSSSYWQANAEKDTLQRLYGISFPDTKLLKEWKHLMEEAAKRDHRLIGKTQDLWFFHPYSAGSVFFLPHGTRIYNTLLNIMKSEYRKRGYDEVITPNIYMSKLWEISGHWQNYSENMFSMKVEDTIWALKPMNCPSHCLMFDHRPRSYRELPLRFADFGALHRNEASGALTGMTRVRRFQQDDAHIFATKDQIKSEVLAVLNFQKHIYNIFGFSFTLNLSTRPEKYLGDISVWNEAERQLEECLVEFGAPWKLNPGDGAFYGPKIDITIEDALKRHHQCATIQLDFQLPIRFNLKFITADAEGDNREEKPVIIHRAIFGSLERFIAIVTEHFGGKWPFWMSPRQISIVPVSEKFLDYAQRVRNELHEAGYYVDVDASDNNLNKKVRNAQLAQYNFILVVGEKEQENSSVNVRTRDNQVHGSKSIPEILSWLNDIKSSYSRDY